MSVFKKALAMILAVSAVFALTACSGAETDSDRILGTWEAEFDVTDDLLRLAAGDDSSLREYFDFDDIRFVARFTFYKDGHMEYGFNKEASAEGYEKFKAAYETGMRKFCDEVYAEQYGSFEQFCEDYGTTPETVLENMLQDLGPDKLFAVEKGRYKVEDGKILYSTNMGKAPSGTTYWVYSVLDDTTLKVDESYTENVKNETAAYPKIFTKCN